MLPGSMSLATELGMHPPVGSDDMPGTQPGVRCVASRADERRRFNSLDVSVENPTGKSSPVLAGASRWTQFAPF